MIVLFMSGVFVLIVELTFVKYDHCGILSQKGGVLHGIFVQN